MGRDVTRDVPAASRLSQAALRRGPWAGDAAAESLEVSVAQEELAAESGRTFGKWLKL